MKFETIKKHGIHEEILMLENSIKNEKKTETESLEIIETKIGNPQGCMSYLTWLYEFQAKLNLLKYQDIKKFRENMFVVGKLRILSEKKINYFTTGYPTTIFPMIMSNNVEIREFLIKNMDEILYGKNIKEYGLTGMSGIRFFNKNMLLALKGDFKELKERSQKFIENPPKTDRKLIINHEFYVALCDGNVEEMKRVIERMLEKKTAKIMLRDTEVFFLDFLHIYVLIYAKIALLHGYDLGIDHANAPKELIDNTPLEEYLEPYDFMKKFRFDFTIEEWKKWIEDNKSLGVREN